MESKTESPRSSDINRKAFLKQFKAQVKAKTLQIPVGSKAGDVSWMPSKKLAASILIGAVVLSSILVLKYKFGIPVPFSEVLPATVSWVVFYWKREK